MRASSRSTRRRPRPCPACVAVLTAEDLKGVNLAWMPTLAGDVQMVLADGKVLFQNQEIAFVVATDRYIAADAADLVEVEYEALPVVVDPFKAMDPDAPILREDIKDKKDGAHGPRKHPNHIFNWQVGDKDLTDAAFAKAEVATKDLLELPARPPLPARDLPVRGQLQQDHRRPHDLRHVPGAARHPHRRRADRRPAGAEDPRHLARHRRRLRQQGRRLSGLHLRRGRLDRDRPAGQMGRGPDREPLHHLVRPRLPHDDRDRGDARRPGHGACACISSPTTARSTPAPIRRNGRRASPTSSPAPTTSRSRICRSTASTPTRRRAASPIAARSASPRSPMRSSGRWTSWRRSSGSIRSTSGSRTSSSASSSPISRRSAGNTIPATITRRCRRRSTRPAIASCARSRRRSRRRSSAARRASSWGSASPSSPRSSAPGPSKNCDILGIAMFDSARDPHPSDRPRHRAHGHEEPGPGPRDDLGADHRHRDRHSRRRHRGRGRQYRHRALRPRHLWLALDAGRRRGDRHGGAQDQGQGADDRRLHARSARGRPRMGRRPLPRQGQSGSSSRR